LGGAWTGWRGAEEEDEEDEDEEDAEEEEESFIFLALIGHPPSVFLNVQWSVPCHCADRPAALAGAEEEQVKQQHRGGGGASAPSVTC